MVEGVEVMPKVVEAGEQGAVQGEVEMVEVALAPYTIPELRL